MGVYIFMIVILLLFLLIIIFEICRTYLNLYKKLVGSKNDNEIIVDKKISIIFLLTVLLLIIFGKIYGYDFLYEELFIYYPIILFLYYLIEFIIYFDFFKNLKKDNNHSLEEAKDANHRRYSFFRLSFFLFNLIIVLFLLNFLYIIGKISIP